MFSADRECSAFEHLNASAEIPAQRRLVFTNDDERRPQLEYSLTAALPEVEVTLSGGALKRSVSHMECKHAALQFSFADAREPLDADATAVIQIALGAKHLVYIAYLDQDLLIASSHFRGALDADHVMVMTKSI